MVRRESMSVRVGDSPQLRTELRGRPGGIGNQGSESSIAQPVSSNLCATISECNYKAREPALELARVSLPERKHVREMT
jgi:hypothetical protein